MQKILSSHTIAHAAKDDIHFLSRGLTQIAFPGSSLVVQSFLIVFQELVKEFTSSSLVLQLFIIVFMNFSRSLMFYSRLVLQLFMTVGFTISLCVLQLFMIVFINFSRIWQILRYFII